MFVLLLRRLWGVDLNVTKQQSRGNRPVENPPVRAVIRAD